MSRFESPWLSWAPNSTRTDREGTDKTDRRAFVGSVGGVARGPEISRASRNLGHAQASSLTRLTGVASEERSPEAPPEDRPAGSACSYFWGRTIKGSCARCGHTYSEHLTP